MLLTSTLLPAKIKYFSPFPCSSSSAPEYLPGQSPLGGFSCSAKLSEQQQPGMKAAVKTQLITKTLTKLQQVSRSSSSAVQNLVCSIKNSICSFLYQSLNDRLERIAVIDRLTIIILKLFLVWCGSHIAYGR